MRELQSSIKLGDVLFKFNAATPRDRFISYVAEVLYQCVCIDQLFDLESRAGQGRPVR